MKKIILGFFIGTLIATPLALFAGMLRSGVTVDGYVELEINGNAERFVDNENGIVCWTISGDMQNSTAISCLKK